MTRQAGDIWLADIPFTDGSASKKRPVLVLWLDGQDAVVAVVTSAAPRTLTDVTLTDWKLAGLQIASTVRLARLDCLEQSLLYRRLGTISSADAKVCVLRCRIRRKLSLLSALPPRPFLLFLRPRLHALRSSSLFSHFQKSTARSSCAACRVWFHLLPAEPSR